MRCGRLSDMATPRVPDRQDSPAETVSEDQGLPIAHAGPIALSAADRIQPAGTRVSLPRPRARSWESFSVPLRLCGLLPAESLGEDGAPEEESYAHDRTAIVLPADQAAGC